MFRFSLQFPSSSLSELSSPLPERLSFAHLAIAGTDGSRFAQHPIDPYHWKVQSQLINYFTPVTPTDTRPIVNHSFFCFNSNTGS